MKTVDPLSLEAALRRYPLEVARTALEEAAERDPTLTITTRSACIVLHCTPQNVRAYITSRSLSGELVGGTYRIPAVEVIARYKRLVGDRRSKSYVEQPEKPWREQVKS